MSTTLHQHLFGLARRELADARRRRQAQRRTPFWLPTQNRPKLGILSLDHAANSPVEMKFEVNTRNKAPQRLGAYSVFQKSRCPLPLIFS